MRSASVISSSFLYDRRHQSWTDIHRCPKSAHKETLRCKKAVGREGLELAACVAPGKPLSLHPLLTKGRQRWNCCEPDKLRVEGGNLSVAVGCICTEVPKRVLFLQYLFANFISQS